MSSYNNNYNPRTFSRANVRGNAPIYISFWLFFFLWGQLKTPNIDVLLFYIYIFLMMSLVLSAAPSFADLLAIFGAFNFDWRYSFYQIGLTLLSVATVWFVVSYYQIQFFHEIVTYVLIFVGYYGFRYGFKGLKGMYSYLFVDKSKNRWKPMKPKALTRRRFKITENDREVQW